jgi:hypothetical protein
MIEQGASRNEVRDWLRWHGLLLRDLLPAGSKQTMREKYRLKAPAFDEAFLEQLANGEARWLRDDEGARYCSPTI